MARNISRRGPMTKGGNAGGGGPTGAPLFDALNNILSTFVFPGGPLTNGLPPQETMDRYKQWLADPNRYHPRFNPTGTRFSDFVANASGQVGIQQSSPWTQALVRAQF